MGSRYSRYLLLSQVCFFAFLVICVAIVPGVLLSRDEGGVSNYGVKAATAIPFTLAFVLCAVLILQAAHMTPRTPSTSRRFRTALFTLGTLLLLVLASTYPYRINNLLKDIHIVTGVLLISFEMTMSLWLILRLLRNWTDILLVAIQAAGCLLALITLVGVLHLLLLAQLTASAAFGVLLVRAGQRLVQLCGFGQKDVVPRGREDQST